MVDIIGLIMANSGLILMIISLVLALVARYFQTKAAAIAEVAQAVVDLTQSALDAVKDGVVTQEELTILLAKIDAAKVAIQNAMNIFFPPATPTQMLGAILLGYKSDELVMAVAELHVAQMKLAKK
jgi:hypothetical protein